MRAFIFSPQRVLWRRFVKRQKLKNIFASVCLHTLQLD